MVKDRMNVLEKIRWRTLMAALGIGLVVELLLVRLYLWYLPAHWRPRNMASQIYGFGKRYG